MGAKVEFPIRKNLFHLVVNPTTSRMPDRRPGTNWYELREMCRWNTKFHSEIPTQENGPTFLHFPLFLGIFQWDEPTKCVPFTPEPEILEILTKWKAP